MNKSPDLKHWQPGPGLPLPRAGCATGVLDGQLIVAGGTYWIDGKKYWCDRVDWFDAAANRWESLAALPMPRGDAPTAVVGETLYVLGGGGDGPAVASVLAYENEKWSTPDAMTLPAPRRSSATAVVGDTIFLFGGLAGTGTDFASLTSTVWAKPAKGRWEVRAPLPGPARFGAAIGAVNGVILLAGGCTVSAGQVINLDDILAYDPERDSWWTLGRLPQPLRGACGVVDGEHLLVIGGYTDRFLKQILRLDATSGRVEIAGELPVALADTRFHRVGSRILGATGENGIKQRFPGMLIAE